MAQRLNHRTLMAACHDMVAAALAWVTAFLLRFNLDIPTEYVAMMWRHLPWVVATQAGVFWWFGLYRGIWRYASLTDLKRIALAVMIVAAGVTTLQFMLRVGIPRSVLILDPILLAMAMAGSRLAFRMFKERRVSLVLPADRQPVLVLGAGEAGANLIAELALSREWRVVGLLDDDVLKRGRQIHGVSILGPLSQIEHWRDEFSVAHAIIALPSASPRARRQAVELCSAAQVRPMTVPSYDDLMSGKFTVSQIRHVELEDLLGRDPVTLDSTGLSSWIYGQAIMVTGAGGSIGSELCRQILRFQPRLLIVFEMSEHALYQMEQELPDLAPGIEFVWAIGDVKDEVRVRGILTKYRPSIVFHAAAYKHVPLMESHNCWEAIRNNVLGTYVLATAALESGVQKMVLISTDKAVNPTSVMGATKRLAEQVCQCLQQRGKTSFISVRFGNVLGSAGSVVPKFRAQIARGGPVTVTHPEVRRFFMSIPEATQLVLQAGLMGKGGEIFILDMGELIKISNLARDLIRLSGYNEDEIRIEYTGLRPGEKLYEELLVTGENSRPTSHSKLRMAISPSPSPDWMRGLVTWITQEAAMDDQSAKRQISLWVPTFENPEEAQDRPLRNVTSVIPHRRAE